MLRACFVRFQLFHLFSVSISRTDRVLSVSWTVFVPVFNVGQVERERAWPLPRDPRPDLYFRHSDQPQLPCWNMTGFPLGIARNASNRLRTLFRPVASPWEGGKHVARSHPETVFFPLPSPFFIHFHLTVFYPFPKLEMEKQWKSWKWKRNAVGISYMN